MSSILIGYGIFATLMFIILLIGTYKNEGQLTVGGIILLLMIVIIPPVTVIFLGNSRNYILISWLFDMVVVKKKE